jgi:asparagine synthase (glutamine-hydrolysing)
MDSSSVIACASANTGQRLPAISTVYEDPVYDESNEIQSMLGTVVEPWIPVSVGTPDIVQTVEEMIEAHEEPVATATWLSHYLLCRDARNRGYKGIFGGLGGDELNAGEYEYFFFFFADLRASGQEELLQREAERWISYHNHPVFQKSNAVMEGGLRRLVDLTQPGRCLPDRIRMLRYREALNPEFFDLAAFDPAMDRPFTSFLKNRTYQDLFRETIPCCIRAEDRNTAAFGLEHFLPFLDHRLVEFMFRVPGRLKIRAGVTKHLLRLAMRGILPEETRTRIKKMGWNAPAHVWFSGRRRATLIDLVRSRSFRERGIYNVPFVEQILEEHENIVSTGAPVENHMMFLWQLVNTELWLRWLDRVRNRPKS